MPGQMKKQNKAATSRNPIPAVKRVSEEYVVPEKEISEELSEEVVEEISEATEEEKEQDFPSATSENYFFEETPKVAVVSAKNTPFKEEPVIVGAKDERLVSCRVIKNHQAYIGGTSYSLTKDSIVSLSNSVATILSNAGVVIKR